MDSALVFTEPELAPARDWVARTVVVTGAATLTERGLLGTEESRELLHPKAPAGAGRVTFDLTGNLDLARARRLDRAARMGAVVVERALRDSEQKEGTHASLGVVLGSAFGSVDASAAFMHRLFDKGPRLVSPAEFPNLVPSSPVGHVSIYLGIEGPALVTADLAASGESACAQAIELVAQGEADAVVAGGIEEASSIVERRLAALFVRHPGETQGPRSEGGAAVVFEAEETARHQGRAAKIIARVEDLRIWRETERSPLEKLAPPSPRARVFLSREDEDVAPLLDASPWRDVPRVVVRQVAGEHEALGAIAMALAVAEIRAKALDCALIVGLAKSRGYALRLVRA